MRDKDNKILKHIMTIVIIGVIIGFWVALWYYTLTVLMCLFIVISVCGVLLLYGLVYEWLDEW